MPEGDPKTWPDSAFPTWKGTVARSYGAGGTQAQHLAHMSRLRWLNGVPAPTTAPPPPTTTPAPGNTAAVTNNEPQTITLLGAGFTAPGVSDVSESLYTGGVGSTSLTTANSGFGNDPRTWPDSAFPTFNGTVARAEGAGGNKTQHAAHIARLEDAKRRGIKTDALAPSALKMFGGMSDTQKYLLIGGVVVVAGVVYWQVTKPKTGLAGYVQRGRKAIGL